MKEQWKPVVGFEDYYQVSNLGKVKRVKNKKKGYAEFLKQNTLWGGYKILSLSVKGKRSNVLVHRIVATAFVPNPQNKPQVNHIDSVRHNNFVSNLEWVTPSENSLHSSKKGRLYRHSKRDFKSGKFIKTTFGEPHEHKMVSRLDSGVDSDVSTSSTS